MGVTEKKNPLGPTGRTVQTNLTHLREQRKLSYAELSRLVEANGRVIPPLGLRRIEAGARRVDADDLVALALALDVAPTTLLMPQSDEWETGSVQLTDNVAGAPQRVWEWLIAAYPLKRDARGAEPTRSTLEFRMRARPNAADLMFMEQLGFRTIDNFERVSYYVLPIPAVDRDGLIIASGAGENEDGDDVVTLAVVAGPTNFEINLSPEDARQLAEDLLANAGTGEEGAA